MKTYVCHYSKNVDRKQELLDDPRFKILDDVTWIDWYDKESLECKWIKKYCDSPITLSEISLSLKHYEALRHMVDNHIPEALVFEDDVVFTEGWLEKLKDELNPEIQFLRLDDLLMHTGGIRVVSEIANSEAQYFKLDFAKFILKNCSFSAPYDNFLYFFIQMKLGLPVYMLPVCSQTSLITRDTTIEQTIPGKEPEWKYFDYIDLTEKLIDVRKKRWDTELLFFEKYRRHVSINNLEYLDQNQL